MSKRPIVPGETHVHYDAITPLMPRSDEGGQGEAAQRVGMSRRSFGRWKKSGLIPFYSADKVAAGLGEHLSVVWPETYGSEDASFEESIVMPGRCWCGASIWLVKRPPKLGDTNEARFAWIDRVTRRPCAHGGTVPQRPPAEGITARSEESA